MDRYKETFETWNNIASIYQDKFMELDLYNATYDFICSVIDKPKAKVLEIGCGPGNITKYLLTKRPDFNIFGIDIAPNMVELAKQNNPTANFAIMDCRKIKSLDKKFDAIIGGFCLPYLSQTECKELISNSYDLLDDNGLIYLSFVEGEPDKSEFKVGSGGRVYFNYYKLDDLQKQLNKHKFKELKTFKVKYKISETEFDIHTILTAKKKNAL
ncbi:MAG: class I SAM-dependent methyltransferase [Flavobacteriaceae bacterium]